jgi:hypothetical protein
MFNVDSFKSIPPDVGRIGLALLAGAVMAAGCDRLGTSKDSASPMPTVERSTFLSDVYQIDRPYRSMAGPWSKKSINLIENALAKPAELLWILGFSAVMVKADGETPASQEYMCHSNIDFDRRMPGLTRLEPALFTLSQGQYEIQFPKGFGVPSVSHETLQLMTQVLNLNTDRPPTAVRHRLSFDFIRQDPSADTPPVKPLFHREVTGLAMVQGQSGHFDIAMPDTEMHGPGCIRAPDPFSKGQHDEQWMKKGHIREDELGQSFTSHWVVPPGRQVNRTLVTKRLDLPYDTSVHFIAVHVHPFAESLELRDRTVDETIFKSHMRQVKGRIGLEHVDFFSSEEGVPMYGDHQYELISTYNNTTDEDQDAMAVMYLYLLAKEQQQPPI